jgi:membrane-associated phospholipid phosphatase
MGIDKGEFRSFPSGHSILSMCMVMILQSLTWFFKKLKDKRIILGVLGAAFSMIIIFTRLILGAHYLSDVSAGAIIVSLPTIIYTLIQIKFESCSTESLL